MVDGFLRKLQDAITNNSGEEQFDQTSEYDRRVRPASEDPYGDPANQGYGGIEGDVIPASQDPYGDPAYQEQGYGGQFGNVIPASQDPYGDPADEQFGDIRPASEDPYGDPADEQRNPW